MKNVKNLLMFVLISTVIFASKTRTDALGGAGYWADDYANISTFPASVNNHNVAWTDGNDFTSIVKVDGTSWGFAGGTGDDVANIMWGKGNMGVNVGFGMTPEQKTAGVVTTESNTAVNVGFGMPLAGMDFGLTYGMGCDMCGGGDVGVNLRRAQNIWLFENVLVGFGMKMEEKTNNVISTASAMDLNIDLYRNTTYDNGIASLFALGFAYNDAGKGADTVDPDATMGIEWNFAVESAMTDWATLRLGYSHGYDFANGGTDGGGLVGGLGFNYGSFNLDMHINTNMFNDPMPYIVGQNNSGLGTDWTISYNW